jgi:hypothetical protein
LFWAGVVRSHDPNIGLGQRKCVPCGLPVIQQLCDAEIQQFWDAGGGYQDIRRLQIAMNNEVLMGIVNRGANRLKELETRIDIETIRIAKEIDGHAIDVFHDKVSAAVGQGATIEQMRDIRVIELRQDLAFQLEARVHRNGERTAMHHLDGDLLLELSISPLGKVNLAHPAGAQGVQHPVGPYTISHHF